MEIKVKDIKGDVYTSDVSSQSNRVILAIHFCTSYTQCEVQERIIENGVDKFIFKDIVVPVKNDDVLAQALDFIAVRDEELGEFIYD